MVNIFCTAYVTPPPALAILPRGVWEMCLGRRVVKIVYRLRHAKGKMRPPPSTNYCCTPTTPPSPRLSPSFLHVAKTCRDQCFDFDNCDDLEDTAPALLASGVALLVLIVVSSLLFCLGIKCKYLGGAREAGGGEARVDPAKTPGRRASYAGANGGREEQKEARELAAAH